MIGFLNDLFYGEYWYISWGIIALLLVVGLLIQLPPIIRAVKNKHKK